jgi:hypothetical protein
VSIQISFLFLIELFVIILHLKSSLLFLKSRSLNDK